MLAEEEVDGCSINRRDALKLSLAAGVALATVGVAGIAEAAKNYSRTGFDRPEAAKAHFLSSMNCAQAILETYAPQFGLPSV